MNITTYQRLVGSLNHLARWTRPDITFAVHSLARSMSSPTSDDMAAAKVVLRYLKGNPNLGIFYSASNSEFSGYSDSDFASHLDRVSISGNLIMFAGGAVAWTAKRQTVVAQSTTEAEYIAMAELSKLYKWFRYLSYDLFRSHQKFSLFSDNQSAINLAISPTPLSPKSKHISVKYHLTRSYLQKKYFSLSHKSSSEMVADIFTKPLMYVLFIRHRNSMGLT